MLFDFDRYSADVSDEKISISLDGRRYAALKVGSSLDSIEASDLDTSLSPPQMVREADAATITWRAESALWPEKIYTLRLDPHSIRYQVRVKGNNTLRSLRYFNGAADDREKWSFADYSRFFTPECSLLDQRYYKSMQYGCIDASSGRMSDEPTDWHADLHWIFTPPPFCYSLGFNNGPWLGAGVAPQSGQYGFSRFEHITAPNWFCFRLMYDGMTEVAGEWASPEFVFHPANDEYEAIRLYCDSLRDRGIVNPNRHPRAEWWSRPIFCGWGEQGVQRMKRGLETSQELATREMYDEFLALIREKGLRPGTVVIDDKWQKQYGTCEVDSAKWPDLRGWIDARHEEGIRVLLWFGAWNPEGLSPEETVKDREGKTVCADPSSPAYQARIRAMVRRMISDEPGCWNADGIKYDWTNMVVGEGFSTHSGVWGIEMQKSLAKQVYDALKAAKPDALMVTHLANPYFADCTDMLRLNDIYAGCREVSDMMAHRARIARIACPHALIDCDNSSAPSHTEWLQYTKAQPTLGVPSLYFLTAVDGTMEPITDEDWDALAPIWRDG
ncbi:MAG: hypothetical protein KBC96_08205 [Armatimonadetes bacterium]|nr:hypothetical protein [Armatimonadota bacterium]